MGHDLGKLERIMNKEDNYSHYVETDVAEGPIDSINKDEVMHVLKEMNIGNAFGPSNV